MLRQRKWIDTYNIKENVVEQLNRLKTDKSPGIDELHPKFLHEVREETVELLA